MFHCPGFVCQVLGAPHSTLPGFMRPRGSSVALSCRMVSMPTAPTSSCSSCRLPSPMPCSPVHVPWSASARLGSSEETISGGLLPLPSVSPTSLAQTVLLPTQLVCKGLNPAELLSILRVYQQDAVEVAVAHVSNNGSWGPRGPSCCSQPSLPPPPYSSSGQAAPVSPEAFRSSLVCTRISGSREIGTQTSVA